MTLSSFSFSSYNNSSARLNWKRMWSSINHHVRHCTLLEKFTKILIFNLSSETHSFLLVSAYNEQWRMMCAAVFCIWLHLHWEEKKFRTHILLKKAARFIQSVCICVRTALSVFLRSLCVFKILQHDVLTFTRSHWYDLQSHLFFYQCCTACCRFILLMSSDDMNH